MKIKASENVGTAAIHWFRKGLRLHDNPALVEAYKMRSIVYPVFCIDPHFANPDIVGVNRYNFLLESLVDLDTNLRLVGSRLFVLRGKPEEELPKAIENWNIDYVTFESDTEPYALARDSKLCTTFENMNINVAQFSSHTIRDPNSYLTACKGNPPLTYASFCKLFESLKDLREESPSLDSSLVTPLEGSLLEDPGFNVPSLKEMGYKEEPSSPFHGGESEALSRLAASVVEREEWVRAFEKPKTSPNSLEPSTTVLSPYLKFGCLSSLKFFNVLSNIYKSKRHTEPPVSLHGQLLWREFFYFSSFATPNFSKMEGNPHCKQIPWKRDAEIIRKWKEGQTGYPFIDAIMTQLRVEGWLHHLARHAVACFLTRGDLFQHWEEGVKVFDLYLIDDDWALNNANWLWLSCSNFFYQYFRVYSPIAFGKKTDKSGEYIRKWIPKLANYPDKYIYEPWKASIAEQNKFGCVIGEDYPHRIVDHATASKDCMGWMKDAYANQPPVDKKTNKTNKNAVKGGAEAEEPVVKISGGKRGGSHGSEPGLKKKN